MAGPLSAAWLPLAIGSLPLSDPAEAWAWTGKYLPWSPAWPQLPRRSYLEHMVVQFSEHFPSIAIDLDSEQVWVDRAQDLERDLERLYLAYLQNDWTYGAISSEYALGLHYLFDTEQVLATSPLMIKGQVTGPITWGLALVDEVGHPVLHNEVLADAVAKHLRLKATWQEQRLKAYAAQTILFVDEPSMSFFGSATVPLSRDQILMLLEEVLAGIEGLKGVHCCGSTDWSLLLDTSADVLSLDAFGYAESLALYPEAVSSFLDRGGTIAWGIVPSGPMIESETATSLLDRLHQAIGLLVEKGISRDKLLAAGWVTPSCGLGSLDRQTAERVLELTAEVSDQMRNQYVVSRERSL